MLNLPVYTSSLEFGIQINLITKKKKDVNKRIYGALHVYLYLYA